MKKLMVVFAALGIVFATQAATVDWSTGRIKTPGAGGEGWTTDNISGSGYLATVYFWANEADAGDISKAMTGLGTVTSDTVSNKALKGTTDDKFAAGTYYTQMIVTKGDSILESEVVSFTYVSGQSDMPNLNFYGGTGFNETFSGTTGAFSAAGWQTVPEPTSGLLLLLGVAGLALRRRRA